MQTTIQETILCLWKRIVQSQDILTFNSPSNFLLDICLSILYICFCAFPRWLGLLDYLKGCCLLWMVIGGLNYVYAIVAILVEYRRVSQQNDVPLGWICDLSAVFTFHSDEVFHYSLILCLKSNDFRAKKLWCDFFFVILKFPSEVTWLRQQYWATIAKIAQTTSAPFEFKHEKIVEFSS